jgi:hypothetical protein
MQIFLAHSDNDLPFSRALLTGMHVVTTVKAIHGRTW